MRISDWSSDVCSSDLSWLAASATQSDQLDGAADGSVGERTCEPLAQGRDRVDRKLSTVLAEPRGNALLGYEAHRIKGSIIRRPAFQKQSLDSMALRILSLECEVNTAQEFDVTAHLVIRTEEHTSELPSIKSTSDTVICLRKKQ